MHFWVTLTRQSMGCAFVAFFGVLVDTKKNTFKNTLKLISTLCRMCLLAFFHMFIYNLFYIYIFLFITHWNISVVAYSKMLYIHLQVKSKPELTVVILWHTEILHYEWPVEVANFDHFNMANMIVLFGVQYIHI